MFLCSLGLGRVGFVGKSPLGWNVFGMVLEDKKYDLSVESNSSVFLSSWRLSRVEATRLLGVVWPGGQMSGCWLNLLKVELS